MRDARQSRVEGEHDHQALGEAGAANNLLRDARQSRVKESANIRHWVRQEQLTTCIERCASVQG